MTSKPEGIHKLIDKAVSATDPVAALQFSQAAVNAANALCALKIATSEENK